MGLVMWWLVVLLSWAGVTDAATRLGLFVTQEELTIWRARAASGPYRVFGDVTTNSPGDWEHIVSNKEQFRSNPNAHFWAGASGWSTGTCITGASMTASGFPGNNNRAWGDWVRDAAFFAMVLPGDSTATDAATKVRDFLLTQSQTPKMNWANKSQFCEGVVIGEENPRFDLALWMMKLLHAYDYVRIKGGVFSGAEQTALEAWFRGAAQYFRSMMFGTGPSYGGHVGNNFPTIESEFDSTVALGGLYSTLSGDYESCPMTGTPVSLYDGSPEISDAFTEMLNNRAMLYFSFAAQVGVMVGDAELIRHAKMYAMTWMTYATWPNGDVGELKRVYDDPANDEERGWKYSGATIAPVVEMADVLARAGDTSVYDYTTSAGRCQIGASNAGGPRGLQTILTNLANFVDHTVERYVPGTSHVTANLIDSVGTREGCTSVNDLSALAQSNLYFTNTYRRNIYLRNPAGGPINPPGYAATVCSAGGYPYGGPWSTFAGVLFLWGQLEGVVDPYTLSGSTPNVTITAPTSSPAYATATAALTTVAGTAFDPATVSSVTWTCNLCGTGTAALVGGGTPSATWTIPTITLQLGTNVLTVTGHNPSGIIGTDQLTITYALPDITTGLALHLKLNENGGTTANDAAGADNPGTLSGGATWVVPGKIGAAAVGFDGIDDAITVPGQLGTPASITLAAWVKPSGVFDTGASTVVSISDTVLLRFSASTAQGTFYTGTGFQSLTASAALGTAWHHLAYVHTPTGQQLYLDGVQIASSASATAIVYTGQGTNTVIGRHGNGQTDWDFAGTLDDIRVYSRALSSVDVAGLASFTDAGPAVTITQPTSSPTYASDTATLTTVAGTASDDVAVTSVTWACPTCTPTSGTATGLSPWSIPTVTLAVGANALTVTATDAEAQTAADSLTVTYTAPPAPGSVRVIPGITLGGAAR